MGNPLFNESEFGNFPINTMKKGQELKGGKKSILITDPGLIEPMGELLKEKEYDYNFNKLVNHALKIGVAQIYERMYLRADKFDVTEIERNTVKDFISPPKERMMEDYMIELTKLLQEEIINSSIIKSLTSSLFNSKLAELKNIPIEVDFYQFGGYRNTPEYLQKYEKRSFKNIRGEK